MPKAIFDQRPLQAATGRTIASAWTSMAPARPARAAVEEVLDGIGDTRPDYPRTTKGGSWPTQATVPSGVVAYVNRSLQNVVESDTPLPTE